MTDWIEHDGGPQPVDDDVWVETSRLYHGTHRNLARWIEWDYKILYRILNQHLIDAARLEGIREGLEAAADKLAERQDRDLSEILHIDPDTIAREAQDMGSDTSAGTTA